MSPELPPARRRTRSKAGYLAALVALVGVGGAVMYGNLSESLVYFVTPTEFQMNAAQYTDRTLRLGGLVKQQAYDPDTQLLRFAITDGTTSYPVSYRGAVPELFKNDNGVVVEGRFQGETFHANTLLVKHSEEYSAPDAYDSPAELKKLLEGARE